MYQVIFNPAASEVFQKIPVERQLELIGALGKLSPAILEEAKEPLSSFKHNEVTYYRYRIEEFRFYFTLKAENIICATILTKNTWADFRMRNNLEKVEEREIETKQQFISLLEKNQVIENQSLKK